VSTTTTGTTGTAGNDLLLWRWRCALFCVDAAKAL
jgi:hypothetical protein